jgi:hypothetical protein
MNSGFLGGGIGPRAIGGRAASSGWWEVAGQTCVAAYQPIGAASLAASYVNLANPGTYDAAPGVAPTLAAGGWVGDGSQWLNSGIVPAANYSMIVRFSGISTAAYKCIAGCYTAVAAHIAIEQYTIPASSVLFVNGGSVIVNGAAIETGIYAIAGNAAYINGASVATGISAWSGTSTIPISIFGLRTGAGAPGRIATGTIAAVAIYSTTLSAADVAALTARMAAL